MFCQLTLYNHINDNLEAQRSTEFHRIFDNDKTNLSEMNSHFKINKSFHLINSKNGKELIEDKKKNILLQLNDWKKKNKMFNGTKNG